VSPPAAPSAAEASKVARLQSELSSKAAELEEKEKQLLVLKDMVRSRQADTRTKEMQNVQLRRRATEAKAKEGGGRRRGGRKVVPASPAGAAQPNLMQVLES